MSSGLADTSVYIAIESRRDLARDLLPDDMFVSVVTLAELEAGVLAASDLVSRSARLRTFEFASRHEPLVVDAAVSAHWARLRVALHQAGRRSGVNDLWLAATALANDLPVVTQDDDFDALAELGLLEVIKV